MQETTATPVATAVCGGEHADAVVAAGEVAQLAELQRDVRRLTAAMAAQPRTLQSDSGCMGHPAAVAVVQMQGDTLARRPVWALAAPWRVWMNTEQLSDLLLREPHCMLVVATCRALVEGGILPLAALPFFPAAALAAVIALPSAVGLVVGSAVPALAPLVLTAGSPMQCSDGLQPDLGGVVWSFVPLLSLPSHWNLSGLWAFAAPVCQLTLISAEQPIALARSTVWLLGVAVLAAAAAGVTAAMQLSSRRAMSQAARVPTVDAAVAWMARWRPWLQYVDDAAAARRVGDEVALQELDTSPAQRDVVRREGEIVLAADVSARTDVEVVGRVVGCTVLPAAVVAAVAYVAWWQVAIPWLLPPRAAALAAEQFAVLTPSSRVPSLMFHALVNPLTIVLALVLCVAASYLAAVLRVPAVSLPWPRLGMLVPGVEERVVSAMRWRLGAPYTPLGSCAVYASAVFPWWRCAVASALWATLASVAAVLVVGVPQCLIAVVAAAPGVERWMFPGELGFLTRDDTDNPAGHWHHDELGRLTVLAVWLACVVAVVRARMSVAALGRSPGPRITPDTAQRAAEAALDDRAVELRYRYPHGDPPPHACPFLRVVSGDLLRQRYRRRMRQSHHPAEMWARVHLPSAHGRKADDIVGDLVPLLARLMCIPTGMQVNPWRRAVHWLGAYACYLTTFCGSFWLSRVVGTCTGWGELLVGTVLDDVVVGGALLLAGAHVAWSARSLLRALLRASSELMWACAACAGAAFVHATALVLAVAMPASLMATIVFAIEFMAGSIAQKGDSGKPDRKAFNATAGMCYVVDPWPVATGWNYYGGASETALQAWWEPLTPPIMLVVAMCVATVLGCAAVLAAMLASSPSAPCGCGMRTFHRRPVHVLFRCGVMRHHRTYHGTCRDHVAPALAAAVAHIAIPAAVGLLLPLHAVFAQVKRRGGVTTPLPSLAALVGEVLAYDVLVPVGMSAFFSLLVWASWERKFDAALRRRNFAPGFHPVASIWDEDGELKTRAQINAERHTALQQVRSRTQRRRVLWLFRRLQVHMQLERIQLREDAADQGGGDDDPLAPARDNVPPLAGRDAGDVLVEPYQRPPATTAASGAMPVTNGNAGVRRRRGGRDRLAAGR